MLISIADLSDPRLADYTRLTDVQLRRRIEGPAGLYMAESSQVIRRALAAGHRPRSFLMTERWLADLDDVVDSHPEVPVFVGAPEVVDAVAGFHVHRGAIAAMQRPALPTLAEVLAEARRVVVLEDIVDHTNVGAIFRCVAGLGFDALVVTPRCADPLYRRSVRVSMGAVFQVPWTRIEAWPAGLGLLREAGFETVAMALTPDAVALETYAASAPARVALLFGSEGPGLTPASIAACDAAVRIPMHGGVDSLNVAAAAAVACWALRPC